MRNDIRFPYHTLNPDEKVGPFEFVGPEVAKPVADPANADVGDVPQVLRQAGVEKVVLVHGTFAGNDMIGLTREIARFSPTLAGHLKQIGKQWFDDLVGELGNYTEKFVDCFSSLINPPALEPIPVIRFHWSGENHHLGRADGVMSLLDLLAEEHAAQRVLMSGAQSRRERTRHDVPIIGSGRDGSPPIFCSDKVALSGTAAGKN